MVKITIESRRKTYADEGEAVLAFVVKEDRKPAGDKTETPVSVHLCGGGNLTHILKNACMTLGAMANQLYERQASRALAYAKMLEAFQKGFDGEGCEVGAEGEKPCGCDACPLEEEDREDGKEAD